MYTGMIEVPAHGDEPYQLVVGQHEGIIDADLFNCVQMVLSGKLPKMRITNKRRDELLPLRGALKCSKCGNRMTGSRSRSRNGTRHGYYHCNRCRQERYRAEDANQTVISIMNQLTLDADSELILKALFKQLLQDNAPGLERTLTKLQATIEKQNARLEKLQDDLADGNITGQEYRQMRTRYAAVKENAIKEIDSLSSGVSEKKELLTKAVEFMSSMGDRFRNASSEDKIRLLGSTFP